MTTAQIIILTVFTILSFGSIIRLGFLSEEKETFIIDQHDYIDNVDGVMVWMKVSNTYTCYEFLDEIGL